MSAQVLQFPARAGQQQLAHDRAWSYARRQLKAGGLALADALSLDCTQGHPVMEIIGLAVVGEMIVRPRSSDPSELGERALAICAKAEVGHQDRVADLSLWQRQLLAVALDAPLAAAR